MRPSGVTAVCIISLVMGAMGGFSLIGGCVALVAQPLLMDAMQGFMKGMPGAQSPQFQQQMDQQQALMEETMAVQQQWMPFMIAGMAILAVAVAAMLIGAIKGLNLKRMAHRWMIIGMAAAIVHAFVSGYVGFGTQRDSQAIVARHMQQTLQTAPGPANPAAQMMANNMVQASTAIGLTMVLGWVLIKCGVYASCIAYLLTPRIRTLFEGDGSDRAIIDALSEKPT